MLRLLAARQGQLPVAFGRSLGRLPPSLAHLRTNFFSTREISPRFDTTAKRKIHHDTLLLSCATRVPALTDLPEVSEAPTEPKSPKRSKRKSKTKEETEKAIESGKITSVQLENDASAEAFESENAGENDAEASYDDAEAGEDEVFDGEEDGESVTSEAYDGRHGNDVIEDEDEVVRRLERLKATEEKELAAEGRKNRRRRETHFGKQTEMEPAAEDLPVDEDAGVKERKTRKKKPGTAESEGDAAAEKQPRSRRGAAPKAAMTREEIVSRLEIKPVSRGKMEAEAEAFWDSEMAQRLRQRTRPMGAQRPPRPISEEMLRLSQDSDLDGLLELYNLRTQEFDVGDTVTCLQRVRQARDAIFRRKKISKGFLEGITTPMAEILESEETPEHWEAQRKVRIKELQDSILFAQDLIRDSRFKALTSHLLELMDSDSLGPADLAEVAYSYALLGIHSGDMFVLLAKTAARNMAKFGPADLAMLFSAFATAKLKSDRFTALVGKRALELEPELTPHDALTLLYSSALSEHHLEAPLLKVLLTKIDRDLNGFSTQDLCRLVWAMSFNSKAKGRAEHLSRDLWDQIYLDAAKVVANEARRCGPDDVNLVLEALAAYSPAATPQGIFNPLVHRATHLIPMYRSSALAALFGALSELELVFPSLYIASAAGIMDRMRLFTAGELMSIAACYAKGGANTDPVFLSLLSHLNPHVRALPAASLLALPKVLGEARVRHQLHATVLQSLGETLDTLSKTVDEKTLLTGLADLFWGFAAVGLRLDDQLSSSLLNKYFAPSLETLRVGSAIKLAWALAVFQCRDFAFVRDLFRRINKGLSVNEHKGFPAELLSQIYQAHLFFMLSFPDEVLELHSYFKAQGRLVYVDNHWITGADAGTAQERDIRLRLAHLGHAAEKLQSDLVPLGIGIRSQKTVLSLPHDKRRMVFDAQAKEHVEGGEEFLRRSLIRLLEWKVATITHKDWAALTTTEEKNQHIISQLGLSGRTQS